MPACFNHSHLHTPSERLNRILCQPAIHYTSPGRFTLHLHFSSLGTTYSPTRLPLPHTQAFPQSSLQAFKH
nr:hypothetical protein Q903MT_gene2958 [Picea sitchensis]